MKKVTTDDKVHVAGIAITDSDVRAYLPDMTDQSRGGDCQSLDGSRSCALKIFANFFSPRKFACKRGVC